MKKGYIVLMLIGLTLIISGCINVNIDSSDLKAGTAEQTNPVEDSESSIIPISDINNNPERYLGNMITIRGKSLGNENTPFGYGFKLEQAGRTMLIFGSGGVTWADGSNIEVTGIVKERAELGIYIEPERFGPY